MGASLPVQGLSTEPWEQRGYVNHCLWAIELPLFDRFYLPKPPEPSQHHSLLTSSCSTATDTAYSLWSLLAAELGPTILGLPGLGEPRGALNGGNGGTLDDWK